MASASEIRRNVQEFLDDKRSLESLDDWSASYSWNIHNRSDAETRDLAYAVRGALVEYSSGDLDRVALREELANAIRPFVSHSETIVNSQESPVWFGNIPGPPSEQGWRSFAAAAVVALAVAPATYRPLYRAELSVTPVVVGNPLMDTASTTEVKGLPVVCGR